MIRLLIASSHQALCESLASFFALIEGIHVAMVVRSTAESMALLNHHPIDVMLWDMSLEHGEDGFGLSQLHQHAPQLPILVLATFDDEVFRNWAYNRGAAGFLSKHTDLDHLVETVKRLALRSRSGA